MVVVGFIGAGLIAFESNRISKIIASPLEELSMGIQRVGLGDDNQRILSDDQGTLGNLMRSFNRMTERLEDKVSKLEEDRQQLRTILSGMVEGVVALDANQRVLYVNDRALILLDLQSHALPLGHAARGEAVLRACAERAQSRACARRGQALP